MKTTFTIKTSILRGLLSLFFLVAMVSNAWGAEKTVTITASALGLSGSYSSTTKTLDNVTLGWTDLCLNSSNIQAKASSGVLKNTSAIPGKIKSVAVTHSGTARSTTISFGTTSACGSESTTWSGSKTITPTGDYTYFKITRGSNAAYWTSVVVTYEESTTPTVSLGTQTIDFGIVEQNATVDAKTISATLSNTNSSTISLSGTGASAFSIDKTTLTANGNITITPNASTVGNYEATLTLSAPGATSATASISMIVEAPFSGSTLTMSAADDANIKFVIGSSSAQFFSNSTPLSYDGITLSGTGTSYYDGSVVRFYQSNTFTLTPATGVSIARVEIARQSTTSNNAGTISCSGLTAASSNTTTNTNVFIGSTTSAVKFTAEAQARFTSIKVFYYPATVEKSDPSFTIADINVENGDDITPVITTTNSDNYSVTYSSSDDNIVMADGDELVTMGIGTATITATMAATTNFNAAQTTFTVTVNAAPQVTKYNVNLTQPAKATIAANPISAAEGATVTLSYSNVTDRYHFVKWYVLDGSANEVTVNKNEGVYTFTMPASTVEVEATFEEDATHNVCFMVNGAKSSEDVFYEGDDITFPENPADINDKKFMGWVASEISGTTDAAPTFVTSAKMGTEDVTYYAVFATQSGNPGGNSLNASMSVADYAAANSWENDSKYISMSILPGVLTATANGGGNTGKYYTTDDTWRIYQGESGAVTITASSGYELESVTVTYNVKSKGVMTYGGTQIASGTKVNVTGSTATFGVGNTSTATNGQVQITKIAVEYHAITSVTYSDYCTSVVVKTLTSIAVTGTPAEFWMGDTFNHDGMTVTATWDDESETNVTSEAEFTTPDMSTAGEKTVTVTYSGKTATYTINVKSIANTQETAYTTAEAIDLIDAGKDLSTKVYVKGTISKVDKFDETDKYITYWLDSNSFEVFHGKNSNGADFASIDDIKMGGTVVVYGTLSKHGSTYEFAEDSWLTSYTAPSVEKTTATMILGTYKKALTTGDDDEYTVTYDGDGTVAVSSSNETVAEAIIVDGFVMVSALKAGTTTITVSAAETENYYAANKSYTLTVTDPAPAAELPFSFDGGKADLTTGMTQTGLGSDYSASPKLKFDDANDNLIINYASTARNITYKIKGNSTDSKTVFDVMESADGKNYTTVHSHKGGNVTSTATSHTDKLKSDSRYVKFVYTTKSGNVALGAISITNEKANPELAFEQSTYRFLTDATEMKVKATSTKGSTGAITYALTTGDESIFLLDEEEGDIVSNTAGSYTVTATIAEDEDYKAGTATCTVILKDPIVANSIIVAKTDDDKYFAMTNTAGDKYITSVQIAKVGDKYAVAGETLEAIKYATTTTDDKTTIVAMNGQYLQATAAKAVSFTDDEYQWANDGEKLTAATSSHGTLQYNVSSSRFTTYANKSGQYATIVSLDSVSTAYSRTMSLTEGQTKWGTICLPYAVAAEDRSGADYYNVLGVTKNGEDITGIVLGKEEGTLEAGKPYLFKATADLYCAYSGSPASAPVEATGLVGNLSNTPLPVEKNGYGYILSGNQLHLIMGEATATVGMNRAYINLENVGEYNSAQLETGASILRFNFDGSVEEVDNETALQQIELTKVTDIVFDLMGHRVSQVNRPGVYVKNGKSLIIR